MKGCEPLTENQLQRLLARCTGKYASRDKALIMLGCRTGFRISELLSLTLADVWQQGMVLATISVRRGHMKGRQEGRSVPLNASVRDYLKDWVRACVAAGQTGQSPLFWSQKNPSKPITRQYAASLLKLYAKKARITGKIATHTLRKTFAFNMYDRLGGNIFKVMQAMGHKRADSTASYLPQSQSEVEKAIMDAYND
jgi:site-specific recombinase XerD